MSGLIFSHRDFDASQLAAAKEAQGLTASLCIPARDEEPTIGAIVASARRHFVEQLPLLDEILVLDDGSADRTAEVAAQAGARVVRGDEVRPEAGPGTGKGDAIWKSLQASRGDLVCWVDGDIADFGPRFVLGLLGPLLTQPQVEFVKGFYRRSGPGVEGVSPGKGSAPARGGRVTELVARPLICRLFPHLAGIVQPLAGEFGGRRELLETLPVVCGWGVDLGLVIDVAAHAGLDALAQVDLGHRRHRHRSLEDLAPQAMAIIATAMRRAGIPEPEAACLGGLVRFDENHRRHDVAVETRERPPLRAGTRRPAASSELAV